MKEERRGESEKEERWLVAGYDTASRGARKQENSKKGGGNVTSGLLQGLEKKRKKKGEVSKEKSKITPSLFLSCKAF